MEIQISIWVIHRSLYLVKARVSKAQPCLRTTELEDMNAPMDLKELKFSGGRALGIIQYCASSGCCDVCASSVPCQELGSELGVFKMH